MGAGWSHKNNIHVWVSDPYFKSDSQVNGEIFVNAVSTLRAKRLWMTIKGIETVEFEDVEVINPASEQEGPTYRKIEGKDEKILFEHEEIFLKSSDPSDEEILREGRFRLPFCFRLPKNLPGSFAVEGVKTVDNEKCSFKAKIKYSIRVDCEPHLLKVQVPEKRKKEKKEELDSVGQGESEKEDSEEETVMVWKEVSAFDHLRHEIDLYVLDPSSDVSENSDVKSITDISGDMKLCGSCISSGSFESEIKGLKEAYHPGDTIIQEVTVHSKNKNIVDSMNMTLYQDVFLNARGNGSWFKHSKIVESVREEPKLEKGKASPLSTYILRLLLNSSIQQNVKSELMRNSYHIDNYIKPRNEKLHLPTISTDITMKQKLMTQAEWLKTSIKAPPGWWDIDFKNRFPLRCIAICGADPPKEDDFQSIGGVLPEK